VRGPQGLRVVGVHLERVDELAAAGVRDAAGGGGEGAAVVARLADADAGGLGVQHRGRAARVLVDRGPAAVAAEDRAPLVRVLRGLLAPAGAVVLRAPEVTRAAGIDCAVVVLGHAVAVVEVAPAQRRQVGDRAYRIRVLDAGRARADRVA